MEIEFTLADGAKAPTEHGMGYVVYTMEDLAPDACDVVYERGSGAKTISLMKVRTGVSFAVPMGWFARVSLHVTTNSAFRMQSIYIYHGDVAELCLTIWPNNPKKPEITLPAGTAIAHVMFHRIEDVALKQVASMETAPA